ILETSFQAQFLIPMAVSIAFGLLFGTVFILFFFPTIILVHNDMRRVWNYVLNDKELFESSEEKASVPLSKVIGTTLGRLGLVFVTNLLYLFGFLIFPIFVFFPNLVFNNVLKAL